MADKQEMLAAALQRVRAMVTAVKSDQPNGKRRKADKVTEAVDFLCSNDSRYEVLDGIMWRMQEWTFENVVAYLQTLHAAQGAGVNEMDDHVDMVACICLCWLGACVLCIYVLDVDALHHL